MLTAVQCCGAGPFLTGSGFRYFFFTSSGSFSYKNRLRSSFKKVFDFTSSHRLRPKSTGSDRRRNTEQHFTNCANSTSGTVFRICVSFNADPDPGSQKCPYGSESRPLIFYSDPDPKRVKIKEDSLCQQIFN